MFFIDMFMSSAGVFPFLCLGNPDVVDLNHEALKSYLQSRGIDLGIGEWNTRSFIVILTMMMPVGVLWTPCMNYLGIKFRICLHLIHFTRI